MLPFPSSVMIPTEMNTFVDQSLSSSNLNESHESSSIKTVKVTGVFNLSSKLFSHFLEIANVSVALVPTGSGFV